VCSGVYVDATSPWILVHPAELGLLRVLHIVGTLLVCWILSRFLLCIILWWVGLGAWAPGCLGIILWWVGLLGAWAVGNCGVNWLVGVDY
jgi:hypothetical protein